MPWLSLRSLYTNLASFKPFKKTTKKASTIFFPSSPVQGYLDPDQLSIEPFPAYVDPSLPLDGSFRHVNWLKPKKERKKLQKRRKPKASKRSRSSFRQLGTSRKQMMSPTAEGYRPPTPHPYGRSELDLDLDEIWGQETGRALRERERRTTK